jgi:hypothetical protein
MTFPTANFNNLPILHDGHSSAVKHAVVSAISILQFHILLAFEETCNVKQITLSFP